MIALLALAALMPATGSDPQWCVQTVKDYLGATPVCTDPNGAPLTVYAARTEAGRQAAAIMTPEQLAAWMAALKLTNAVDMERATFRPLQAKAGTYVLVTRWDRALALRDTP